MNQSVMRRDKFMFRNTLMNCFWVVLGLLCMCLSRPAEAATRYWNTTGTGLWTNTVNWLGNAAPFNAEPAVFNAAGVNGDVIVQLDVDKTSGGITVTNTGTTAFQSANATVRTLTIGTGGITINTNAGAVTFGHASYPLNLLVSGSETWANSSTNLLTVLGNITNSAASTLTVSGSGRTLVSGTITDGGGVQSLTLLGPGTLTLTCSNSYSGANALSAVVQVGANSALGSGGITVPGGTLQTINSDVILPNTLLVSFSGGAFFAGSNNLTINGKTTGNTGADRILTSSINPGTLTLANVDISNGTVNRNLSIAGTGNTTITGTIADGNATTTNSLLITSTGSTTLSGTNTYRGGLSQTGNGTVNLTGVINGPSNVTVNSASAIFNESAAGVIAGTGTTFIVTAGTAILSGTNTYTGATRLNGGTLSISSDDNLSGTNSALTLASGILKITGTSLANLNLGRPTTFSSGAAANFDIADANATFTVGQVLNQGSGGLGKFGAGTLVITNVNTFTGYTTIYQGTLQLGNGATLSASSNPLILGNASAPAGTTPSFVISGTWTSLTSNGRAIAYETNSTGTSLGGTVSGGAIVLQNSSSIFIDAGDSAAAPVDLTINSSLTGLGSSAGFTKRQNGVLLLDGNNSYGGWTKVEAGVLRLGSANALPGGIGSSGGSNNLYLAGGVVELGAGDFSRGLGAGLTQVQITTNGGFSAYGGKRQVNLGGAAVLVTWGSGSFVPTNSALILNSTVADSEIEFKNPINLNALTCAIQVNDNPATNSDFATVSGVITNGALVKTGSGTLVLAGSTNRFTGAGLTVSNGTLVVSGVTTGSVLTVVSNATVLVNGNYTDPVSVQAGGTIGGTGTVAGAALSFAAGAKLKVTVLSPSGATDALTVSGSLDLTNLSLDLVNTNLLTEGTKYRVLTGSHSGTFASSNLPADWIIDYQSSLIQVKSAHLSGMLIKIQ